MELKEQKTLDETVALLARTMLEEKKKTDHSLYGVIHIAPQNYLQPQLYPSDVEWIDGKPVVKRNEYMMGKHILGLCWKYSGLIEILEGLNGRDKEKVLEHELGHREHPMRSEEENRRKTYTEEPNMHPMVSYVG